MKSRSLSQQKGMVLVVGVLLIVALLVLGAIAMITTTTELKMTGFFKSGKKVFYIAEAGIEDAKARLRAGVENAIVDGHPTQSGWEAYIGTVTKSQGKGYNSGNAMHIRVDRLQSGLDYVVTIVHQTDGAGNILYWGDVDGDGINERTTASGGSMRNIYKVTSEGSYAGASRTLTAELARMPPINVPAALYVNATTTVQGSSTNIIGTDGCGGSDLAGIVTTQGTGSVTINSRPNITGAGGTTPNITYGGTGMNVQSMIDRFKGSANFKYTVNAATHTATSVPGPGDGWGIPTPGATSQLPSSCSAHNIVYYNTAGTDIQLSGGATGCGLFLVEGDLMLHGNFSWYGVVITTGSITFTGGGNKNVTGAMLAGGSADADLVGGNANIVYCSSAVQNQTENQHTQVLSWKDKAN